MYDASIPLGLIGYSLGGGISFCLALKYPDLFQVLIQNAPFVGFSTISGHLSIYNDAKSIAKFYPDLQMIPPLPNPLFIFMKKFVEDPLQVKRGISAQTVVTMGDITDFLLSNASSLNTPFHAIIGELDQMVSKDHLTNFFKQTKNEKNQFLRYPQLAHYILQDGVNLPEIISQQLDFLNSLF